MDPSTTGRGRGSNRKQKTRARAGCVNPGKHGGVFGTGQESDEGTIGDLVQGHQAGVRAWVGGEVNKRRRGHGKRVIQRQRIWESGLHSFPREEPGAEAQNASWYRRKLLHLHQRPTELRGTDLGRIEWVQHTAAGVERVGVAVSENPREIELSEPSPGGSKKETK